MICYVGMSFQHAFIVCSDVILLHILFSFLVALGLRCCMPRLSLVVEGGGSYSLVGFVAFSLWWLLSLQSLAFSNCSTRSRQLWLAGPGVQGLQ